VLALSDRRHHGTNGKSTTTSLVGLALERAGRRHVHGRQPRRRRSSPPWTRPRRIAVAEVSSFQLEWVERFRPHVGGLLNVTPDHLDRHGTLREYRDTKARSSRRSRADDFAVVNRDDPRRGERPPACARGS
jgi:UDP-N-acetylmuramoylalanine--D-glutamate ligase